MVRALVKCGMKVAGCARRVDRLRELEQKLGKAFVGIECDLTAPEQIAAMFARVRSELGPVAVLINNAGCALKAPLMDFDLAAARTMLDLNVLALAQCTSEAVKDMRAADFGHIVHVSSLAGHRVPNTTVGFYSATKHAVRAMTEALRRELREAGSKIRVSQVSPGLVQTEFAEVLHGSSEKAQQMLGAVDPLEGPDVVATILFMLSAPDRVEIHDVLMRPTNQSN